jgi:adenine-specific DNA-methyltransferase
MAKSTKRKIEQYQHADKKRANNPPVGLVTPATDKDAGKKTYAYDPHLDPSLQWAGKAEHTSFDVPTVSLHVHERIDPRSILDAVRKVNGSGGWVQSSLFEQPMENLPLRKALEFYGHAHGWSNRLIAGDSLLVMNSLLEKEGLAGKVQMVYIDPPYGIKYGSNFQPFVNKRDVKDRKDEDLTQEPEMIRAFRDTWELGIHSYLTYLRDRLLLARELLHESGSCFVQISDENVHHVREVMDEAYGTQNFISVITFVKTTAQASESLPNVADFLLWYAKDRQRTKYRQLFFPKTLGSSEGAGEYIWLRLPDGLERTMTPEERRNASLIPDGCRVFRQDSMVAQGATPTGTVDFEFQGKHHFPGANLHWKTTVEGLSRLAAQGRLVSSGRILKYKRFLEDFPVFPLTNNWRDTGTGGSSSDPRIYAVQTVTRVVQRCLLMATDPGDLILDPTCGSGTTAYVAEQWGRR